MNAIYKALVDAYMDVRSGWGCVQACFQTGFIKAAVQLGLESYDLLSKPKRTRIVYYGGELTNGF